MVTTHQTSRDERPVWILAGEPSGDRYGADLALALRERAPPRVVRGMGCARMREAGADLIVDASNLSVVGFVEVLKHLGDFRRAFHELLAEAEREPPAAVILIDNPGFNLRIAKQFHRRGIPVLYYVCPQVWAWGKKRIPLMAQTVDRLLAIFPFEPEVFAGTGLDARFVGHPLVELLERQRDPAVVRTSNIVVLLPGSRVAEVEALLPAFLAAAGVLRAERDGLRFVVSVPSGAAAQTAERVLEETGHAQAVELDTDRAYYWMQRGAAGIAASGTVTLEAAILGLPLVVGYRLNRLTYFFVKRLVKLEFFTIVNLVAGRLVFAEFVQDDVRGDILAGALREILPDGARRADVEEGMADAVERLGPGRNVAGAVAESALEMAEQHET